MNGDAGRAARSIFANELEEILFQVTPRLLERSNEHLRAHFPQPLLDDIHNYRWAVNLELMHSDPASPVSSPRASSVHMQAGQPPVDFGAD